MSAWASPEFQEKLEGTQRKAKLYSELVEVLASAGFPRTQEQIINKLKKLKSDYRDAKKQLSKSGTGYDKNDIFPYYDIIDGAMGHRPANQVTGSLNSATAALDASIFASSPSSPSTVSVSNSTPNDDGRYFWTWRWLCSL